MTRFLALTTLVFICVVFAVPAGADDPPKKLTAEERTELEAKWKDLNDEGMKAYRAGKYPDAITTFEENLKVARRLYNANEFPEGHTKLAASLNNLASLYQLQGKLSDAEMLFKDMLEINKRMFKGQDHPNLADTLHNFASLYHDQGKLGDAESFYWDALEMRKRLYKGQDKSDLAVSMNNLASLYHDQGKLSDAESLFKEALEMQKRLFKDHVNPDLARSYLAASMTNLAALYRDQRKLDDAEPLFKEALEIYRRLYKGRDHPNFAKGLNNLASLYKSQDKLGAAEPLYKDALEMRKRLFKGKDHVDLAHGMTNLGLLYHEQGKLIAAEPLCKGALEMCRRLFPDRDHLDLAYSLDAQALVYLAQGKLGDAEPLFKQALKMYLRLLKGPDHPGLTAILNNLAMLYRNQGRLSDAESLYKDALERFRRLAVAFALDKTEGETLTLLARQPVIRDAYLSTARGHPIEAYAQVWADKGFIARAYERRLLQARALATDPKAAQALTDLSDARRRRAELLLAPSSKDPATLAKRKQYIAAYEDRIEKTTRDLKVLLPASIRADKFAAPPSDLQKALPADAAVVDFLRFVHFEYDSDKPGKAGETRTPRYLAFVMTKQKVVWVELETAKAIEPAVNAWRAELTSGKALSPDVAAKVRELIWEKVRKELPEVIKTVYLCPDAVLCQVPFAALPGDKPGTILLEDYAVAMIPHAPFLLDKLWPQDPIKNPPTNALVVGGVKYDAGIGPGSPSSNSTSLRDDPLMKPGAKHTWSFLGSTVGEAKGVAANAERRKLPVERFEGDKATEEALLKALPKAKYAHFGTHRFFADPTFLTAFLEKKKDTLVGAWEVVKSENEDLPAGTIMEFKVDGSLTITIIDADRKSLILEYTYKHEGNKIPHTEKGGGAAKPEVETIEELTADKLVTVDKDGQETEFKKKKNRGGQRIGKEALGPLALTGLVFAGANNEKSPGRGIVTGEQIIDLDLSGLELAVLTGCETGLGDMADGQGAFGLQHAFHYAGTTNVVCSLWKTPDDSTAALMNLFYTNLWDKNSSPIKSLRQAQLEVYRNPGKIAEWAKGFRGTFEQVPGLDSEAVIKQTKEVKTHPLYWAAFTLSGPGR